jgi:cytochrome c551/c552
MSSPLQQTTSTDIDAVPESTVAESRAPAGSTGSPLPSVGTNAVSEWTMWDPNLWWTDWSLPPDPRPSWERWFDWVNQLQALTPALGEASQDWQTMVGQFDESLRTVRAMRTELAGWTGPSAQTMSESLDRLEDSITTKTTAIRDNPAKLQELAQTINDAVAPMSALDAEYQQVLADLNACRQVAERGRPIMLNLATTLLQTGTDLENSVRTDNLAPQPVPPQALTLTDGPQGPGQQLTQVAGSANLTDPGTVTSAAQIPMAAQPTVAGATNSTGLGQVTSAQPVATTSLPGVAVGPADQAGTNVAASTQTDTPALAGLSAGAAPAQPGMPALAGLSAGAAPAQAGMPAFGGISAGTGTLPNAATLGPVLPMAQSGAVPAPGVHPSVAPPAAREDEKSAVVAVPVPVPGITVSGSAAVPASLRGRTGARTLSATARTGKVRRTRPGGEAFPVEDAGDGTGTATR